MTVLRDGTVVNESINAHNFTKAANVPATFGCGKRRVENITIHHWGLPGQSFDGVVTYLASNNARSSSAHAIIMAGRATSIVSPYDAAWHAGNALGATISIGLELRPEATDGDYITAAAYIAMLWEEFGYLPLVPHNYWKATACPGKWDLKRLEEMARNGSPTVDTPPTEEDDMPSVKEIVDELLYRPIPWYGYNGTQPTEGRTTTNLAIQTGYADAIASSLSREVSALKAVVEQLAVAQGVVIDYAAIAKAVNDDAAKRQAE